MSILSKKLKFECFLIINSLISESWGWKVHSGSFSNSSCRACLRNSLVCFWVLSYSYISTYFPKKCKILILNSVKYSLYSFHRSSKTENSRSYEEYPIYLENRRSTTLVWLSLDGFYSSSKCRHAAPWRLVEWSTPDEFLPSLPWF